MQNEKLKNFSVEKLLPSANALEHEIPYDYITDNLITKKEILYRIEKLNYCNESTAKNITVEIDQNTGEIINSKTEKIHSGECGIYCLCPMCGRKRSDVIIKKYMPAIEEQHDKHKNAYLVTFTIENQDNFNTAWRVLTDSIRAFRRKGQKRNNGYSGGEAYKIKSGIGCAEIKAGKNSGKYHLHFHYIFFTDEQIDYHVYDEKLKKEIIREFFETKGYKPLKSDLRKAAKKIIHVFNKKNGTLEPKLFSKFSYEWYLSTGGNGVNIDIRPIDKNKPLKKQVREIIKYTSKISDLTKKQILEVLTEKDNKRFLSTWGELRKLPDIENETEENENTLKYSYIINENYKIEKGIYENGTKEQKKYYERMINKKGEIREYIIECNWTRAIRNKYLNEIKPTAQLLINDKKNKHTEEYINRKKNIIKEVDSIRNVYKHICKQRYKEIVNIYDVNTKKIKIAPWSKRELFYYNIFMSELDKKRKLE